MISDPTWSTRDAGHFTLGERLPRRVLGRFQLSGWRRSTNLAMHAFLATYYCASSRIIATWSCVTRESLKGPVINVLEKVTRPVMLAAQNDEALAQFHDA